MSEEAYPPEAKDLCEECHQNIAKNSCDVCYADLCDPCTIDYKGQLLCIDCKSLQEEFEDEDEPYE